MFARNFSLLHPIRHLKDHNRHWSRFSPNRSTPLE